MLFNVSVYTFTSVLAAHVLDVWAPSAVVAEARAIAMMGAKFGEDYTVDLTCRASAKPREGMCSHLVMGGERTAMLFQREVWADETGRPESRGARCKSISPFDTVPTGRGVKNKAKRVYGKCHKA